MKKWIPSLIPIVVFVLVGCGGGGGGGGGGAAGGGSDDGTSGGGGDTLPVYLTLPDNFEREPGILGDGLSWLGAPEYEFFRIGDYAGNKVAEPTNNDVHVNVWYEEFAKDQFVSFTIARKPGKDDTSSVGLLLRVDIEEREGYLVTFVPQSGLDTIRLWKTKNALDTVGVEKIFEYQHEFAADNEFRIEALGDTISLKKWNAGANGYDLLVSWDTNEDGNPENIIDRGGHIGIYAVTRGGGDFCFDCGAIDDFNGGNL